LLRLTSFLKVNLAPIPVMPSYRSSTARIRCDIVVNISSNPTIRCDRVMP
jgi:hypothetical protein